ncbi:hypothetical protein [Stenotrophomonas maltophilia]|uniref:hypothetical protein n=1 Tax=Stenotrophomonas maltophilia TaxID=40324 RepID=UPI000E9F1C9B|nr:hypothetical protein [Stenotrophomonas maltophilia]MCO7486957.1 hypothetical protein [Stenotrophomonas maltophilia]HBM64349.1 hypothetical protein [Pseudomonas sp.]
MLWRFSADNTHLYPGALLRRLDIEGEGHLSAGDELLVEFSDGAVAIGRLLQVEVDAAVVQMPSYRTRKKTTVAERAWRLTPSDEPGTFRVNKRLPAA